MKWDTRFLGLASVISDWSKDTSTQVGAVIVRPDRTIASIGYNGFPRGVKDDPERIDNRDTKYAMTVHAEINAILSAREPLSGYTMYVDPFQPCSQCAAAIIQSGISQVITWTPLGGQDARWSASFRIAAQMFEEAGVALRYI